jgi:hypothetical protein
VLSLLAGAAAALLAAGAMAVFGNDRSDGAPPEVRQWQAQIKQITQRAVAQEGDAELLVESDHPETGFRNLTSIIGEAADEIELLAPPKGAYEFQAGLVAQLRAIAGDYKAEGVAFEHKNVPAIERAQRSVERDFAHLGHGLPTPAP